MGYHIFLLMVLRARSFAIIRLQEYALLYICVDYRKQTHAACVECVGRCAHERNVVMCSLFRARLLPKILTNRQITVLLPVLNHIHLFESFIVVPLLTYLLTKEKLTPEEVNGLAIDVIWAGVDTVSRTVSAALLAEFHEIWERPRVRQLVSRASHLPVPGARFSKNPKLYGPFSGVTIPFVSQERR